MKNAEKIQRAIDIAAKHASMNSAANEAFDIAVHALQNGNESRAATFAFQSISLAVSPDHEDYKAIVEIG